MSEKGTTRARPPRTRQPITNREHFFMMTQWINEDIDISETIAYLTEGTMLPISEADIRRRIARDNPWWASDEYQTIENTYPKRAYFEPFKKLALNYSIKRAVILLGPRRVGKTVMIKQLINDAISEGISRNNILYISIDTPVYSGMTLEKFISFLNDNKEKKLVLFDEIQYLKNWESHLKDLVDNYNEIKFVATGSAAAALKLKSQESGAGRFTDFMLPPLTFHEFLTFLDKDKNLIVANGNAYETNDINELNKIFIEYLNYGGYPEAVLNPLIKDNAEQFIKNDIIDKVLLKDLPSLYGITEIQELNRLFSFIAYNAGSEASLSSISSESGLAKPTITKYIQYLESAFLIIKLKTVDDNCKSLMRERNFKLYLNNPSMRAALFAPVEIEDSAQVGHLTECAIFSQWQHSHVINILRYARWKDGEVDIALINEATQRPNWMGEIKWSDRIAEKPTSVAKNILHMAKIHNMNSDLLITSKTISDKININGVNINIIPSSLYCYTVGRNITSRLTKDIN